jgi:hypothetical protein
MLEGYTAQRAKLGFPGVKDPARRKALALDAATPETAA